MKILLVEDTRSIATILAARLASFGHEVAMAENGQMALEQFAADTPDLILMDIEMPLMNGFEATSRIRQLEASQPWAWTPIIFLTATATEENLLTAIEAGGDDFMAKNVSEAVLHAKMQAMGRIAQLRCRLCEANAKLDDMASRDGLTGLYNRRLLDQRTDQAWAQALEQQAPFGLLMLDIDNFKRYNDHYGHQAGDDCLRATAQAIGAAVEAAIAAHIVKEGFAARYGGEEFTVVLPGASDHACSLVAGYVLKKIRELAIPHAKNADLGIVTASIGVGHSQPAGGKIAGLFHQADERLYWAKQNGRNQFAMPQPAHAE